MGVRSVFVWLLCLIMQSCVHPVFADTATTSPEWKITKTEWSEQDEQNFQSFVRQIGEAVEARRCQTVSQCLNSAINPYRATDPTGLTYRSDCADFPYYLRAYFAWKSGLPFVFANNMDFRSQSGSETDIRYSKLGNRVISRRSLESVNGKFKNALSILNSEIPDATSSANYRTHYQDSNTDFYPVQITLSSIRAGTTLYDPNGHVALVYKVSKDGKVSYIDAHPDNSVSAGVFGPKFMRSNPGQGAGFKNWRPVKLVGATLTPQGFYINGKMVLTGNEELADFSSEQFFGNSGQKISDESWSHGHFLSGQGQELGFYEFVRQRLTGGNFRTYPIPEFKALIAELCGTLKDRVHAVETAIQNGVDRKPHPGRLPVNIYGAEGEWEDYSTPSRDAQLKFSFNDLILQAADFIRKWRAQDPNLSYHGTNLPQDLLETYGNEAMNCQIRYSNSNQQAVTLNLEEIRQRLFKLSFDPYHCVERRWGAINASELASCKDGAEKSRWYEREQRMRNQHIRQFEHRMDFTLDELLQPFPGNGNADAPDVDILKFLNSQI